MIKEIVKDDFFSSQIAEKAMKEDLYIGTDLKDTLQAILYECVGKWNRLAIIKLLSF